jgi:ribosomal protein S18 acetylase RimI-like enzyme
MQIRKATAADTDWITGLAPRLHEFGPAAWRDVAGMNASVQTGLAKELADPTVGSEILAAVDPSGTPLGFVSMRTDHDYFTSEPIAHVVDIVVAREGEGRGVGRFLLAAAEQWAKDRGCRLLSLNVFEGNDRARRVYEQVGFTVEWTRMLKHVSPE